MYSNMFTIDVYKDGIKKFITKWRLIPFR